jgi:hypothetical protein
MFRYAVFLHGIDGSQAVDPFFVHMEEAAGHACCVSLVTTMIKGHKTIAFFVAEDDTHINLIRKF